MIINNGLPKVTEIWGMEASLYYPELYAGTTDLVGVWKGRPAIMDFKQTNKPKKREYIDDYFLQLVAYSEAHNHTHGTDINTGVILMCARPKDTDSTPEYQEFVLEGVKFEMYRQLWWKRVEQYYMLNM